MSAIDKKAADRLAALLHETIQMAPGEAEDRIRSVLSAIGSTMAHRRPDDLANVRRSMVLLLERPTTEFLSGVLFGTLEIVSAWSLKTQSTEGSAQVRMIACQSAELLQQMATRRGLDRRGLSRPRKREVRLLQEAGLSKTEGGRVFLTDLGVECLGRMRKGRTSAPGTDRSLPPSRRSPLDRVPRLSDPHLAPAAQPQPEEEPLVFEAHLGV